MKKTAVIHDLSGFGKCSLTAAIPILSVMGVQAVPLPTAVLSGQTGYGDYVCEDFTAPMAAISKLWKRQAVEFDGIYSGFLLNERQADQLLEFIRDFSWRETLVVVDPVLGDNGKRYDIFDSQMELAAGRLAEQAHVITPNLTEALLLGRQARESIPDWKAVRLMGRQEKIALAEDLAEVLTESYHHGNRAVPEWFPADWKSRPGRKGNDAVDSFSQNRRKLFWNRRYPGFDCHGLPGKRRLPL